MLQWLGERSSRQIEEGRSAVLTALEEARSVMHDTGAGREWFGAADSKVSCSASDLCLTFHSFVLQLMGVSKNVGGKLFEALLRATNYVDCDCVNMFREGAPLTCFRM